MNILALFGDLPLIEHAWTTGEKLYNDGGLSEKDWVAFKDAVWALLRSIADGQFDAVIKTPDVPDVSNPSDPVNSGEYTPSPGEHGNPQPLPPRDNSGMSAEDLNKAEWALVAKYAPWDLQQN